MTGGWAGSTRRDDLPPNWPALRVAVLTRDRHQCQWRTGQGQRCLKPANQVDHTKPRGPDTLDNLRALCEPHHNLKSSREGVNARKAKAAQRWHPNEPHPGQVTP